MSGAALFLHNRPSCLVTEQQEGSSAAAGSPEHAAAVQTTRQGPVFVEQRMIHKAGNGSEIGWMCSGGINLLHCTIITGCALCSGVRSVSWYSVDGYFLFEWKMFVNHDTYNNIDFI